MCTTFGIMAIGMPCPHQVYKDNEYVLKDY